MFDCCLFFSIISSLSLLPLPLSCVLTVFYYNKEFVVIKKFLSLDEREEKNARGLRDLLLHYTVVPCG